MHVDVDSDVGDDAMYVVVLTCVGVVLSTLWWLYRWMYVHVGALHTHEDVAVYMAIQVGVDDAVHIVHADVAVMQVDSEAHVVVCVDNMMMVCAAVMRAAPHHDDGDDGDSDGDVDGDDDDGDVVDIDSGVMMNRVRGMLTVAQTLTLHMVTVYTAHDAAAAVVDDDDDEYIEVVVVMQCEAMYAARMYHAVCMV